MYVLCLSISCYSLNEEIFTSLYSLSHSVFVLDAQHVSCCIATTFQHTLLVGRSRDRSPAVSRGIRHVHVPGVDSASKNEYQDIPVVKDGPVRNGDDLTIFMCRVSRKPGSLNLLETSGPVKACNGIALPSLKIFIKRHIIYLTNVSIEVHN